MDQLICASLSHAHYWYEVGMLKVPADICLCYVVCTYVFMCACIYVCTGTKYKCIKRDVCGTVQYSRVQ